MQRKFRKYRGKLDQHEEIDSLSELPAAYLTAPNITRRFDRARPTLWCKQTATEARHFADKLVLTECRSPRKWLLTKIPAARPRESLSSNVSSTKKKRKKKTDERYQFSRGLVERTARGVLEKIFRVRRVPRKIDPPRNCFSPEFLMQHRFFIRLLFLELDIYTLNFTYEQRRKLNK